MKIERHLRMAAGDGENSYAANSSGQKKAILQARPVLQKAIEELYASLPRESTMVIADLGCSSGPNSLVLVSEVVNMVQTMDRETGDCRAVEMQFFLNDLPGNDFNLVFRSLEELQSFSMDGVVPPPYYVAGLPGSFYTRLLPCNSVHLFHSSYCLMWRSKVPEGLSRGTHINEDNIYIGKTTPATVAGLFHEQFQKDFKLFLALRYSELVCGGRMLLTFLCQKTAQMSVHGGVGGMWELLSEALKSLVLKGLVEKEKLVSFNLPFYAPSVDEVMEIIKENALFKIEAIRLSEPNWDWEDDSDGDTVHDCRRSGGNIAKAMRAVIGPLIINHFGSAILDELFLTYASIVTKHLQKGKAKNAVIMVSLQKAMH